MEIRDYNFPLALVGIVYFYWIISKKHSPLSKKSVKQDNKSKTNALLKLGLGIVVPLTCESMRNISYPWWEDYVNICISF